MRIDGLTCTVMLSHSTGKAIHSMTAHMDAVTGLAVDPHGLYLLSGSKSPSIFPLVSTN